MFDMSKPVEAVNPVPGLKVQFTKYCKVRKLKDPEKHTFD